MHDERSAFNALLRHDLPSFVDKVFETIGGGKPYRHNWHIDVMVDYLMRAFNRDIKRLIITLPPRYLKSICVSVAFPAWALGQDPSLRFIGASYSAELAGKHSRDCRGVMETDWYKRTFPKTRLNSRKQSEAEFETTKGGFRLSTSVGGTLTGRGGNFIIIDDPIKPSDAHSDVKRSNANLWFDSTLISRLDDKVNDVIIIVSQRVHVDDLVGHVLEQDGWVHLNLPAIAEAPEHFEVADGRVFTREPGDVLHPKLEPLEILEKNQANMGSFIFNAQYQQAPVPVCGNMVKWEWFRTYRFLPEKGRDQRIVQSWDTANKASELSDYSVCTTWLIVGDDYYLTDVFRERLDFPDLYRAAISQYTKHKPSKILVEDASSGTSLIQALKKGAHRAIGIKPEADKITRLNVQMALIEAGHVHIPESAPWLDEFKAEVLAFPNGKHDDQVDSLSQFLNSVTRPQKIMTSWAMPY